LALLKSLAENVYSRTEMLLMQRDAVDVNEATPPDDVTLGEATVADINRIIAVWPPEFAMLRGRMLHAALWARFESAVPCFIATDTGGIVAAMWCTPWHYDAALGSDHRGRPAFEVTNLFTVPRARGRGLACTLLGFALARMAGRGNQVAYSRILPERQASVAAHKKAGFRMLGRLVSGQVLGCRYCRLMPFAGRLVAPDQLQRPAP